MSDCDEEIMTVRVFRKRVIKTIKIENVSELAPSEKITFDVEMEGNVYILCVGTLSNENAPYIYFSIDPDKNNVKKNLALKVTMKDLYNRPFFQGNDLIKQNSLFSCPTKYTVRDIPKGCLIIRCELSYLSWAKEEKTQEKKKTISCDRVENLSLDFGRLYAERTNADVVMQVGRARIPVHSQILSARSEVFAAMFKHDMTEKLNKTIEIPDVGEMAMHYFLVFVYTGKLENIADFQPDMLKQLYSAADKYAVMELKEVISDILLSDMSPNNVTCCASLGFIHDDARMQKAAVTFISGNLATLDSKQWRDLEATEPSVAAQVLNNVCTKA